jgi:hypothetical protein
MKTTIDLPDEMLHRVKIIAAQRKTTLKELVIQGLLHVTEMDSSDDEKKRTEAMRRLVAGLKATNSKPMVPLKREQIYDR